jgi:hypothetical protein
MLWDLISVHCALKLTCKGVSLQNAAKREDEQRTSLKMSLCRSAGQLYRIQS